MFKRSLTLMQIGSLVFSMSTRTMTLAKTKEEKAAEFTSKVKTGIAKLGVVKMGINQRNYFLQKNVFEVEKGFLFGRFWGRRIGRRIKSGMAVFFLQFAPGALKLTPDQVELLKSDNVVSDEIGRAHV